jgi:DNA polymerase-1
LRDIASRNGTLRAAAERTAINTPVQGTAADLIKLAMVAVHTDLRDRGLKSKLVLQVHDELVLDVLRDEVEEVREIVIRRMSGAMQLAVPLRVDVGVGSNWLEAH